MTIDLMRDPRVGERKVVRFRAGEDPLPIRAIVTTANVVEDLQLERQISLRVSEDEDITKGDTVSLDGAELRYYATNEVVSPHTMSKHYVLRTSPEGLEEDAKFV